MGALPALPKGWFIDYQKLKSIFVLGSAMLAWWGMLCFAAPHWTWLYAAIIIYYLGSRIICTACTMTCAAEPTNERRATGRGLCRTLASPVAIIAPLPVPGLVSSFGGISAAGIRPLFAVQACIFVGSSCSF